MNSVYERMASDYGRDLRLLQSKYDQLEAAYQALAESGRKLNQHINELQTDNAELRIEKKSLSKDAGRYRWLKENGYHVDDDEFMPHIEYGLFVHADRSIKSIDQAIDAAMGEGK